MLGPERGSGVPEVTQQVLVGGRPPGCYFPVVLGSPSSAPLPAGRRLHQCWLPRPRKTHFFPLSSQRKQKWLSSQRSPCQWVGRFQDASEWTGGGQGPWLLTGQCGCQSPKPCLQGMLGTCRPWRSGLLAGLSKGSIRVRTWGVFSSVAQSCPTLILQRGEYNGWL